MLKRGRYYVTLLIGRINKIIMQKFYTALKSFVLLGAFGLAFTSCKDDEPEKFNLSFASATGTAKESDESILIEIKLDKPAPEDIKVKFKLSGTALDDVTEKDYPDYKVDGDYDAIVIAQGETSANITLIPYSDDFIDDNETIIVTITEVDNVNVIFDATQLSTTTLTQEDGMLVYLEWPASNSTAGFVDMDMFVRIGASTSSYNYLITGSVYPGTTRNYEAVFIPKTFIGTFFGLNYTNTTYGLSYNYYDGTRDDLKFEVTFAEFINGVLQPEAAHKKYTNAVSYTKDNINTWTDEYPSIIAQTFANVGGNYQDFSEITTPVSGSRTGIATTNEFINPLYREKTRKSLKTHTLPEKYRHQF